MLFLCALGVEILDREMPGVIELELPVLRFVTDKGEAILGSSIVR